MRYISEYYRNDLSEHHKYAVVIPQELCMVDINTGHSIGGKSGVREYEGYYFMLDEKSGFIDSWDRVAIPISYDFGKGFVPGYCWGIPFLSEKDGRWYLWLIPWRNWFIVHFGEIKGMESRDEDSR